MRPSEFNGNKVKLNKEMGIADTPAWEGGGGPPEGGGAALRRASPGEFEGWNPPIIHMGLRTLDPMGP